MKESTVLEEEFDANYEPTEEEVLEYAQFLGMDTKTEQGLFWIAKESLKAPLPTEWKPCQTSSGSVYYFNFKTGESIWDHPCDEHYRNLYKQEKEKLKKAVEIVAPIIMQSNLIDRSTEKVSKEHAAIQKLLEEENDDDWDAVEESSMSAKANTSPHSVTLATQPITMQTSTNAIIQPIDKPADPETEQVQKKIDTDIEEIRAKATKSNQNALKLLEMELKIQQEKDLDELKSNFNKSFEEEKKKVTEQASLKLSECIDAISRKVDQAIKEMQNPCFDLASFITNTALDNGETVDSVDRLVQDAKSNLMLSLQAWERENKILDESLKADFDQKRAALETKHNQLLYKMESKEESDLKGPSLLTENCNEESLELIMDRIKSEEKLLLQAKHHLISTRNFSHFISYKHSGNKPKITKTNEERFADETGGEIFSAKKAFATTYHPRNEAIIKEYKEWFDSNY